MVCLAALNNDEERQDFEAIYEDNKGIMYAHAYSILKDVPSAEDAVQDAFVALAKNYEKTSRMDCNQIRSYLIIITRNASYKIYNKRKRETATEEFYDEGDEDTSDIAADSESRELREKLFGYVKALDSKYGDVIMLKYYCDMKEKEIADALGISIENVKIRLHRARNLLKKSLREGGYHD